MIDPSPFGRSQQLASVAQLTEGILYRLSLDTHMRALAEGAPAGLPKRCGYSQMLNMRLVRPTGKRDHQDLHVLCRLL